MPIKWNIKEKVNENWGKNKNKKVAKYADNLPVKILIVSKFIY